MFVIRVTNGKDHWIVGPFDSHEEALAWKEKHVEELYEKLDLCIVHPVTHPDEAYQQMQTFLPLIDFNECARVLDRARLGKQCVECGQIHSALIGKSKGWRNHPATKMWKGYEDALKAYWFACAVEWGQRGYNGHMHVFDLHIPLSFGVPRWLGNPKLHSSHRAALLAKLPDHYGQFGWNEKPIVDYWWPTKNGY